MTLNSVYTKIRTPSARVSLMNGAWKKARPGRTGLSDWEVAAAYAITTCSPTAVPYIAGSLTECLPVSKRPAKRRE